MKKIELPVSIRLSEAVLCEDCRLITASKNSTCTICGSSAIWNISKQFVVREQTIIDNAVEKLLEQM